MDSTVIVALPAVDEKVMRISSEQVPHLTMVFLPPASQIDNLEELTLYVQHAAEQLSPFYLTVDYRGELGEDSADVLFFEDNSWDLKRVKEFRHHLLLNDTIKRAYDSVEQFPEWTPHLTLGYPETPAKEDDSDYPGIHSVRFDRIAVFTGDYEGPEFRLKYDETAMEVAMSDMSTIDRGTLAASTIFGHDPDAAKQYGKKGMKWGVRKDEGHEGERVKTKKLEKLDKQWENQAFIKAHNKMADKMNNGLIDEFNNRPEYKDVDFTKPENAKKLEEYETAFFKESDRIFMQSLTELGLNPSGTKRWVMKDDEDGPYAEYVDVTEVKHAEGDTKKILRITLDALGHFSSVTEQEVEFAHYGVKGMRWGVRKDDKSSKGGASSGPTAVVVTQKKPGKFAKTEGGQGHKLHEDAERALVARQKAKSSTTDALSNAELRSAIERMQLEQKYSQLEFGSDRRSRGARFIAGLFGQKKPTKFRDMDEEYGEKTRDAVEKAFAARAAAKAAKAVA